MGAGPRRQPVRSRGEPAWRLLPGRRGLQHPGLDRPPRQCAGARAGAQHPGRRELRTHLPRHRPGRRRLHRRAHRLRQLGHRRQHLPVRPAHRRPDGVAVRLQRHQRLRLRRQRRLLRHRVRHHRLPVARHPAHRCGHPDRPGRQAHHPGRGQALRTRGLPGRPGRFDLRQQLLVDVALRRSHLLDLGPGRQDRLRPAPLRAAARCPARSGFSPAPPAARPR
ncbi:hypothetical protein SBRY_50223 [Actinacidiphila bryophytorum]|uniref:Uncharacterized protein n=1 Tax=Actinacidiphila bryophytorum TaxID=1436133 RepID=A0A9W4H4D9_9ACTN|nr:hypothetical protein SBRY_50223 [Actinacidiphila bryophytorum]